MTANFISALGNLTGLQLISTTTSASPLQVNSSNFVSNLNVQYLNGQLSSYYTNASNISSGILNVSYGGTGLNSLSSGYIPFGQGSNYFGSSSNLYWNNVSKYLGIGTSSPSNAVDIAAGSLLCRGSNFNQIILQSPVNTEINYFLPNNTSNKWTFGQGSYTTSSNFGLGNDSISNVMTCLYSNGYVGIGTSNPNSRLTLANTSNQLRLLSTNSNSIAETYFVNSNNYGWTMGLNTQFVGSSNFGIYNTFSNNPVLTLGSNNQVGINNSNPLVTLDVVSPTSSSSNVVIRGGQSRQVLLVPGYALASGCANEIVFNVTTDYTNLAFCGAMGMNTAGCGASNLAISASGRGAAMVFQSNSGYVGIGTCNPSAGLHVTNTCTQTYSNFGYINSSGSAGKCATNVTYAISIQTSGGILCGGEVDVTSDFRLKTNSQTLDLQQQIDFLKKITPCTFKWKDQQISSKQHIGFMAQDIIKTGQNIEELINASSDENLDQFIDDDGFVSPKGLQFSLNYDGFIPIHTKILQHLLKQTEKQQTQIDYILNKLQI